MSYDISLIDKKTKKVIEFDKPHKIGGGTYAMGGTTEAWLNITYNYGKHFYHVFGEKGIRSIYGKTAKESIPIIEGAMQKLDDNLDKDYWKATEGNAKMSLAGLLILAKKAPPDSIWDGD